MKRVLLPLLGSFALHGVVAAVMGTLSSGRALAEQQKPVVIEVVDVPPPKEPPRVEPPPPPRPKPAPVKIARAPKLKAPPTVVPRQTLPPPPDNAPPPPTTEAKETTPEPVIVTGITMESTSGAGSFAVGVGNTLHGDPGRTGHDPATVKPYKAARYSPAAQVSELPRVLNRDGFDIRKYYPAPALKSEFEGDVVLRLLIDSDGSIAKVEIVSDPGEGLGAAAARAVREFRFAPATVDGTPVATTIPYTIRFVITR